MSTRIGIIGLGRIGRMHARNLAQEPGVDEVVLIGRNADRLAASRADIEAAVAPDAGPELAGDHVPDVHGSKAPTTKLSSRVRGEQWLDGLDGVIVASSTDSHPRLAKEVVAAGVPALIEKPLALDLDELGSLTAELDETGVPIMVAFHRRYDEGYQNLRQRIQSGDMGPIRIVHAASHDHYHVDPSFIPTSGGIWRDLMIHEFDTIPWLLDQAPVSVFAAGAVIDDPVYTEQGDVDTASALVTFESGAQALISGARNVGSGHDVGTAVYGSDAAAMAGLDAKLPVESTEPGTTTPAETYDDFVNRFEPAFRSEIRHFVAVVHGEADSLSPPASGIVATRLAIAAEESARTGKPVHVKGN